MAVRLCVLKSTQAIFKLLAICKRHWSHAEFVNQFVYALDEKSCKICTANCTLALNFLERFNGFNEILDHGNVSFGLYIYYMCGR